MSDTASSQPIICTIFAKNYLAHVRVLTQSFLKQHPNGRVIGLLCDSIDGRYDPKLEAFTTLFAQDIGIPDFFDLTKKYTVTELCTAVKPFLLNYLFKTTDSDRLCYFDPDIMFFAPMNGILECLQTHNIVLIPHLTDSYADNLHPTEHSIMAVGAYNLGFIGLRRSEETERFLVWWGQKLLKYCYVDVARNYFVDQRWIDLVPGMYTGVYIERDSGYNVAYWNLPYRQITKQQSDYLVNGVPLKFFHFSGYSPNHPDRISNHQDRLSMDAVGVGKELFQQYSDKLLCADYKRVSHWNYSFSYFSNGTDLSELVRVLWREAVDAGLPWADSEKPEASESFYKWLAMPTGDGLPMINRVAMRIYETRQDIQEAFPDIQHIYRHAYVDWFIKCGIVEYNLDPMLGDDMRKSLISAPRLPLMIRCAAKLRPWLLRMRSSPTGQRLSKTSLVQAFVVLFGLPK